MSARPPKRVPDFNTAYISLILFGIVWLLSLTPMLRELNQRISDSFFRLQPKQTSSDVVVVSIDDASLAQVGRWPWPRDTLARLVRAIATQKPKVIGIDVLLSEPQSEATDDDLRAAISAAGNIVLVDKIASFPDGPRWVEPLPIFAKSAAAVGHAHAVLDSDGVCRTFPPTELSFEGTRFAFALEVAKLANPESVASFARSYGVGIDDVTRHVVVAKPSLVRIPFRRDPVRIVSAGEVLSGQADGLQGRVVLVGFGAVEIGDRITTPVSRGLPTPGVEIHAQILDGILTGRRLRQPTTSVNTLMLLALCAIAIQSFRRWRGWKSFPTLLVLGSSGYSAGFASFCFSGYIVPLGTWLIALGVAPLMIYGVEFAVVEASVTKQLKVLGSWLAGRSARDATRDRDLRWRLNVLTELQQELGSRFELYRALLEATYDLVAVFDHQGHLLFANHAFSVAFGAYLPANFLAVLSRLAESKDAPLVAEGEVIEGEATLNGELYAVRVVPLPGTSLTPGGGKLLSMTSLHLRVERDRAREESLGFVTHELRTPLVAIQGFAELMTRMPNAKASAQAPETILRESRRLLALINSYLDVLRMDAGARPLRLTEVSVKETVFQVFELLTPIAHAASVTLELSCDASITLVADEPLLTGALLNLISNGIKYGKQNSAVRVEALVSGGALELSVHNVGDPIFDTETIFDTFVRASGIEDKQAGWGLGLSLVKRIVEKHHGTISVRSTPQAGTTFTVRLPGTQAKLGASST